MENKYQNGKIYKLVCNDGYYYIGSTTQELNNRLNNHIYLSKSCVNKVYHYINFIGWDNVTITLIENYSCNSKKFTEFKYRFIPCKSKISLKYFIICE